MCAHKPFKLLNCAALLACGLLFSADRSRSGDLANGLNNLEQSKALTFDLDWPPQDPATKSRSRVIPLLLGKLHMRYGKEAKQGWVLKLQIELERPTTEEGRESWNSKLAFPEIDWMRDVRVWDVDNKWLWPNLAYLLRIHGQERVERYGGVDPGKGVDNDFAAVLIRKYDAAGLIESKETTAWPLVAAEWYPEDKRATGTNTIVNKVSSDEFTLHLGKPKEPENGQARVWVIFADFLGAKPPSAWPKKPEYAGGILAFFEVKWTFAPSDRCAIEIIQTTPKESTGFNWERWAKRTRATTNSFSTARLSDVQN